MKNNQVYRACPVGPEDRTGVILSNVAELLRKLNIFRVFVLSRFRDIFFFSGLSGLGFMD